MANFSKLSKGKNELSKSVNVRENQNTTTTKANLIPVRNRTKVS